MFNSLWAASPKLIGAALCGGLVGVGIFLLWHGLSLGELVDEAKNNGFIGTRNITGAKQPFAAQALGAFGGGYIVTHILAWLAGWEQEKR